MGDDGCHYRTLEVAKSATLDEIKAAFRRLSKETHPDVAKSVNPERFKRISNAASVLTDPKKRRAYDMQMNSEFGFGGVSQHHHHYQQGHPFVSDDAYRRFGRSYKSQKPNTGAQLFMTTMFRPRHLALGSISVFAAVQLSSYLFSSDDTDLKAASRVHAWKNPNTGNWEQPAPWDPTYQQLKPQLELVPREQVKMSSSPKR